MPPFTGLDFSTAALFLVPMSGGFITGLIWLIRLEGRVNTLDSSHLDVKEDVRYIRDRIDRALEREIL